MQENLGPAVNCLIKSLDVTTPPLAETSPSAPHVEDAVSAPVLYQTEAKESDIREQISEIKISPKPPLTDGASRTGFTRRSPSQNEIMDKREGFRSALNTERSKGNRGKSYWGHDDRFEKDDSPIKERNAGGLNKPRASEGNWRRPTTPKDDERKSNTEGSWRPPSKGSRDIVKTYSASQQEESWD